jgi:4-amino-4-deoxy-L-arabinose transferase-like glycosyltransferase
VLVVFLVALAVRLYGLTYHSLWFDEVMSAFWAAKPAGEIWRVGLALAQDKHPPLYYLALNGWSAFFGLSDAALRTLGAFLGALAVLPVYGIGRTLGSAAAAGLAALLVALNPFLVWYSQEARMFMPATTAALVGLYGIVRIAAGESRITNRWQIFSTVCYLLLAAGGLVAGLYTYLFSAFLLPVAGAWVILAWALTRREPTAGWRLALGLAAVAAATLLFLPLARQAWLVSGGESAPGRPFGDLLPSLWRMLEAYAFGWSHWPDRVLAALPAAAAVLAAAGLVVPGREPAADPARAPGRLPAGGLFLALWLTLPVLAGGLLLARDRTVFAETRYFIFLAPALCLAWGRALAWLWDRRRAVGLAAASLAFGVTLASLPALWSPQNRREAWREAAAFVQTHAGPNDAILIQADYVRPAFERYFGGRQPIFTPFTDRLTDPARVAGPLEGLAGFSTVWLVQSHHEALDPRSLVASWFAARYPLATEVFPAGVAVRAFAQHYRQPTTAPPCASCGQAAAASEEPGVLLAGDRLRLVQCDYAPGKLPPRDAIYHPPSSWVHVITGWRVGDRLPAADLQPRARLIDAQGRVWGDSLERPNDALDLWPISRWQPGELVRVDYDVNLNPVTPPGVYRLVIDVPETQEQAVCGEVVVTGDR